MFEARGRVTRWTPVESLHPAELLQLNSLEEHPDAIRSALAFVNRRVRGRKGEMRKDANP